MCAVLYLWWLLVVFAILGIDRTGTRKAEHWSFADRHIGARIVARRLALREEKHEVSCYRTRLDRPRAPDLPLPKDPSPIHRFCSDTDPNPTFQPSGEVS